MAIVSVAELRKYMSDISLSANQQSSAQVVLDGTQQALETYLGRPIQPVQVREKRRSDSMGDIALSVTPVHKVISLRRIGTSDNVSLSTDMTPLSEEEVDRVWDAMPETDVVVPGGLHVGQAYRWYIVEYIGGYNGYVDDFLKLQILEVASRTMTVNHDDVLTIKDDIAREPANASSIQKGWRDDELLLFDRLRRRTIYR